jgi:hypothetical protein
MSSLYIFFLHALNLTCCKFVNIGLNKALSFSDLANISAQCSVDLGAALKLEIYNMIEKADFGPCFAVCEMSHTCSALQAVITGGF